MKRKVIWGVMSGWMVAALLLTSCAPAVVKEAPKAETPKAEVPKEKVEPEVVVPKKEADMVKWTGTKLDGTVVEKMIEKPRYGGIHVTARADQPETWDSMLYRGYWQTAPVTEPLQTFGWARGPAGTEEWLGRVGHEPDRPLEGRLSTSWERLDPETLVYHIRQGVHFALDPTNEASRLVGGRELTAADIVAGAVRNWTEGYYKRSYRYLSDMENPANSIYVSPTDKWVVVFKSKPGGLGLLFRHAATGRNQVSPPELLEKYGEITDWRNVVGTGPFMLKSYVPASAVTYVKNPDYWGYDPFFPENQLPYLDGFRILIIPDASTQMAALRTGKIDFLTEAEEMKKEQADSLLKTNPELQMMKILGSGGGGAIHMRLDRPEQPWADIRVRRALMMAINNVEIRDLFWEGDAEVFSWPVAPKPESMHVYVPLEEMPQSVQELYGYHPDKARQLLAEAGYPDGFSAQILTETRFVDLLSIVQNYWADIGVELNIEPRATTVFAGIRRKKSHPEMLMWIGWSFYIGLWTSQVRTGGGQNYSIVDDPWHKVVWEGQIANYFDAEKKKEMQLGPMGEGMPPWNVYANEQVWAINLPQPYGYRLWQPWLKGHSGATETAFSYEYGYTRYAWLDQELKKDMGY